MWSLHVLPVSPEVSCTGTSHKDMHNRGHYSTPLWSRRAPDGGDTELERITCSSHAIRLAGKYSLLSCDKKRLLTGHVTEETWLRSRLSQDRQRVVVPVGTGSDHDSRKQIGTGVIIRVTKIGEKNIRGKKKKRDDCK